MKQSSRKIDRKDVLRDLRRHYREYERNQVAIPTKVSIVIRFEDRVYTRGTAIIRNISLKGVLLAKIVLRRQNLPLKPFWVQLDFKGKKYHGIGARCRPIHFSRGTAFELGLEFEEMWVHEEDRKTRQSI